MKTAIYSDFSTWSCIQNFSEETSPENGLLPRSDPNCYSATQQFFSVKNNEEWKENQPSSGKFLPSFFWIIVWGSRIDWSFLKIVSKGVWSSPTQRETLTVLLKGWNLFFFFRKNDLHLSLKAVSKSMDWRPLQMERRWAKRLVIELVVDLICWLGVGWEEKQMRKRWK